MAVRRAGAFAQPIRTLFRVGAVGGLADRQLLDRFAIGDREAAEAAFRALVERHGPMVLRACRVVLENPHDAEDAFQATFLILARQAGSIRDRDSVASWLHKIAWRIAAHGRAAAARRREIERQGARPVAQPSVDPERRILDTILHEELIRLPEKYRKPIVLCYLEGLTHDGAAEQLGWPVGTVRGRLARARDLLRRRLTRRGVTAPAALAGVGWLSATSPAAAAVPAALGDATVEVVLQVTSGRSIATAVSAEVAAMTEGASRILALSRWKTLAAMLLLVGAIGIGSGLALGRPSAVQRPLPQAEHPTQSSSAQDQATAESKQPAIRDVGGERPSSQPLAEAQHDVAIERAVVDDQGKPVAGAEVVIDVPVPWSGKLEPVVVRATTDAEGRFRFVAPSLRRVTPTRALIWAFHPGLAITVVARLGELPRTLVLHKPAPKTITIEGPDSRPIAGVRVSPLAITVSGERENVHVPDSLAEAWAVMTGPDGKATLDYLAAGDELVAVRVAAESIGTQDLPLVERPGRQVQGPEIKLRLKPTSRLAGRVRTRAGDPVADQVVEVWSEGGMLRSNPVGFKTGPLRTAADGSFQTPDNLLVGSSYRVVVRAPGMEPILSDWITISAQPRVLLPMIQRPLRTVSGRVVDRQGKALASIEVFQSGDGPQRTATQTDADGRFVLGGFRQGSVFLFARGEGFRFGGRLVKPGDRDITIELTRTIERPARVMRMLPDPIPLEESRALARRLMEPCWEAAVEQHNSGAQYRVLNALAAADPVGVQQKMAASESLDPRTKAFISREVVRALTPSDPARAETVAEAIPEPGARARALVAVFDALPDQDRKHKLALLDRAALHAKAATALGDRVLPMSEVAERWYELGEKEKAKTLFSDALRLSNTALGKGTPVRGLLAARLARVDLRSALAIAKEFPSAVGTLANIAFHLAADNPAEAEHVLSLISPMTGWGRFPPPIAWKMAAIDPGRARRLTDQAQQDTDLPQRYLFLALGLKASNPAAANEAFQTAMQGYDQLMKEGEYSSMLVPRAVLLPMIEQIDPALVPEYFWRVLAMGRPLGNPRSTQDIYASELVNFLAWYDRDVAAALYEPLRDRIEQTDDKTLANSRRVVGWSLFDPRAAVARLEQVPFRLEPGGNGARERVSELLGLAHGERWRKIWSESTEMGALFERDLR
jgi:RNA polymerase sigma factor (sigma-70 family)